MMNQADLSSNETALILKFRTLIDQNGGSMTHDMSDPEHRAFVKLMHNVCGNTEDDFPGLHGMLDEPQPAAPALAATDGGEGGWTTSFGVPEVGFDPGSKLATARGYGTVVNGFQTCNLSVLVWAPNGDLLANGSAAGQAPLNSLAVVTRNDRAHPYQPGSMGMLTYSYRTMSGEKKSGTTKKLASGAVADPTIIEPKRENNNTNPYNPNAICIGLGRPNDLTRCDYIYNEPSQDNPIGRLPLVGNVTFTDPIKSPLQPNTNFFVDIYVIRTDHGGKSTPLDATDLNNIFSNFNIDPGNGKALQWNLPMRANTIPPPPDQPNNPVVFSKIPWATEMISYLTVNITVVLNDGSQSGKPVVVTIQSSDVADSDPIDGVTYIKPIEFVWHCLGEETEVSMADGTTRTIPKIKAGDQVLATTQDENATVSVTHNGNHFHDVYVLETEDGKTLVASAEHVIFTADGGVSARDLAAGARLITPKGPRVLKAIRREPGGGRNLWNLSLGAAPQIDDKDPNVGQFYANGILVGDARASRAIRHRQINDIDWVKAHVPESFHKDVESTFRQRKRILMR
jgi:hypothetical protein